MMSICACKGPGRYRSARSRERSRSRSGVYGFDFSLLAPLASEEPHVEALTKVRKLKGEDCTACGLMPGAGRGALQELRS